jgi:prepilin-type N-terminal cleavage/methylation domain-containing protein
MVALDRGGDILRRGFTAIELAVVLAVIGIAMIILIPALQQGHKKASETLCLERQHQVGIAMTLYRHDNGGSWPHARTSVHPDYPDWADPTGSLGLLYPEYVSKSYLFECPATDDKVRFDIRAHDLQNADQFYISPAGVDARDGSKGHEPPSEISYFYDGGWPVEVCIPKDAPAYRVVYGDECVHGAWRTADGDRLWLGESNHERGGNFLFADIHVEWIDVVWSGKAWDIRDGRPEVPNPYQASISSAGLVGDDNVFESRHSDKPRRMDADLAGMVWVADGWKEF